MSTDAAGSAGRRDVFERTLEDLIDEAETANGVLLRETIDVLYLRRRIDPDQAVCQGRREIRPKGGAKHCHRGRRGEVVRGGRDEAGALGDRKLRSGVRPPCVSGRGQRDGQCVAAFFRARL